MTLAAASAEEIVEIVKAAGSFYWDDAATEVFRTQGGFMWGQYVKAHYDPRAGLDR